MVAAELNKMTTTTTTATNGSPAETNEDYELLPDEIRQQLASFDSKSMDGNVDSGDGDGDGDGDDVATSHQQSIFAKYDIVWRNVLLFALLHLSAIYGVCLIFTSAKIQTTLFAFLLYECGGIGITAGAHRLWAHKAYKAKTPLKLILLLFNTLAFQDAVLIWARDHRVHHKFSETDADPHNAKNGFFFAHIGWLLCRKHPDVTRKGKLLDISDLESCPLLKFQKKYYYILMPLICFILPTIIPMVYWNESYKNSVFVATLFRYALTLNVTWLVNSAAHLWGQKPYDKHINPVQNKSVAILAFGEGWHNYHHTFPWDYKTSEFKYYINFTTAFINLFAKLGWAYDMKTVSHEMIEARVKRTGDGSHHLFSRCVNATASATAAAAADQKLPSTVQPQPQPHPKTE